MKKFILAILAVLALGGAAQAYDGNGADLMPKGDEASCYDGNGADLCRYDGNGAD